jgi:formamidopyrimidine-DNA glycosylase
MPELPEVETVTRGLNANVLRREIIDVEIEHSKIVREISTEIFKKKIKHRRFVFFSRLAKNILGELDNGDVLWIHLKMTGHLLFKPLKLDAVLVGNLNDKFNGYIRLSFIFKDGSRLCFSDLRKFGRIKLIEAPIKSIKKNPEKFGLGKIGPEPLAKGSGLDLFTKALLRSKKPIKPLLLVPAVVAGIGNIYASEILFRAKISPLRLGNSLKQKEIKNIWQKAHLIFKKAIKLGGTSVSDFRNIRGEKGCFGKELLVYGRAGKKCPVCAKIVQRIKQGGRSTFYCSFCQK